MKTYEKMKAAIVDLSNVLDEALAFEEYKKTKLQPAFAGNAGGNISGKTCSIGGNLRFADDYGLGVTTRGIRSDEPMAIDADDDGYMVIENS